MFGYLAELRWKQHSKRVIITAEINWNYLSLDFKMVSQVLLEVLGLNQSPYNDLNVIDKILKWVLNFNSSSHRNAKVEMRQAGSA